MNYTDISTRPGKGPRAHRNVSNPDYRSGWDRIFGKKIKRGAVPPLDKPTVKCTECDGYGELPQGTFTVECRVCEGTGRLVYAN